MGRLSCGHSWNRIFPDARYMYAATWFGTRHVVEVSRFTSPQTAYILGISSAVCVVWLGLACECRFPTPRNRNCHVNWWCMWCLRDAAWRSTGTVSNPILLGTHRKRVAVSHASTMFVTELMTECPLLWRSGISESHIVSSVYAVLWERFELGPPFSCLCPRRLNTVCELLVPGDAGVRRSVGCIYDR